MVTVTYFPGETVTLLLESVEAAADWVKWGRPTVVMADNGSTDGSIEEVEKTGLATVLHTGGNLGFGGGANAGVAALPKAMEWVLICNSDLTFAPGAIEELLSAAGRHPRAGALGPMLLTPDGQPYPSARELPSIGRGVGHAAFGWVWPRNPWTKAYRRDHEIPQERGAGWLSGACLLVRRSVFDQLGGFDPAFFMFFEDVDLGDRIGRAGWENVYVPSARVTHIGGHSTQRHQAEMTAAHHRSAYVYLARRYVHWWQAPLRMALKAGLTIRSAMARRSAALAGGADLPTRPEINCN
ncbi:glycosyltransferase family 2 protein [Nakamurella antarctica]|uniref:Glycosyltransferase family 2 protein n=1 Tax=Nakamurella antarctica TaxID=1902245 RepID=A0A3G8ZQM8_9ACTN|nr:glycosyltransferase family 2 protein [Nakamurella antarctica]